MVQFGVSTRLKARRSSFPLLLWASRSAVAVIVYICLSMIATMIDMEAPADHGDLVAIHLAQATAITSEERESKKAKTSLARNAQDNPSAVPSSSKENESKEQPIREKRRDSSEENSNDSLHIENSQEASEKEPQIAVTTSSSNTTKIGFAVTITNCGTTTGDMPFPISEGAAVLSYSIRRASIHGNQGGRYDYELYAIYHPDAEECAETLRDLGYTLLKRDTPVQVNEIQGDFLREKIAKNGCCGERELIKLEAYTLTQHAVMVILDLDALILQPMDAIFDLMLQHTSPPNDHIQWKEEPLPSDISMIYTIDYAMVNPKRKLKPVQGGFVVMRPNQTVYEEFRDIVRKGDYRDKGGWGGKSGKFWGSMTFQGLLPYYYKILHPGRAVEFNRCIYNNMCSNHRTEKAVNDTHLPGDCFTQEEDCEDCRARPVEEIVSTHFTVCQKPWLCMRHAKDAINHRLCRSLHAQWYLARSEMETSWGRSGYGNGTGDREHFHGYCHKFGERGYDLIQKPYGKAINAL
jgi:hypothetical protein